MSRQPIGLTPHRSVGFVIKGRDGSNEPSLRIYFVIDEKPYELALWASTSKSGQDFYSGKAPVVTDRAFVDKSRSQQGSPSPVEKTQTQTGVDDEIPF